MVTHEAHIHHVHDDDHDESGECIANFRRKRRTVARLALLIVEIPFGQARGAKDAPVAFAAIESRSWRDDNTVYRHP